MNELSDVVLGADLAFGRDILDLREQLLAAKSVRQIFQLVEAFLLHQAGDAIDGDIATRCIDYALSSIVHKPAIGRLRQLSEHIGYSQKHFINLFTGQVGVSPKQYLKIMRFQKAIRTIENPAPIQWSQIALESGYYDQAHFINDFKYFSGFTPNEYLRRRTALLNYVPVD